jgi:hypothetical protein
MKERLEFAISQLVLFVKNPRQYHITSDNTYAQLFDIATVTSFATLLPFVFDNSLNLSIQLIFLLIAIPLSRVGGWLTLNFYGLIFDYYLEKLISNKFINGNSVLLINQQIVVYASISSVIGLLPLTYVEYISSILNVILLQSGIKSKYNLTEKESWLISILFVLAWWLVWWILFLPLQLKE